MQNQWLGPGRGLASWHVRRQRHAHAVLDAQSQAAPILAAVACRAAVSQHRHQQMGEPGDAVNANFCRNMARNVSVSR